MLIPRSIHRWVVVAFALTAGLTPMAFSATAMAHPATTGRTWYVAVGAQNQSMSIMGMLFTPNDLTVNQGDTIVWVSEASEPHTVTFVPPGQPVPDFGPAVFFPAGGSSYDGTGFFNSGVLTTVSASEIGLPFVATTYRLTINAPVGHYTYYCAVHPGMQATIHVKAPGSAYPVAQEQYAHGPHLQLGPIISTGHHLMNQARAVSDNHHVAVGFSQGNVDVMRFTPSVVTIHVGESVTFTSYAMGPHTVTFGEEQADITAPYGDPTHYDGSAPLNSGFIFAPQTFTVTFTKAGTYPYFCGLHDYMGMVGTVVVE